jgi:hypothetical protein
MREREKLRGDHIDRILMIINGTLTVVSIILTIIDIILTMPIR